MLYDCENLITDIVSVEHLKWKSEKFEIAPRNYSALAFRISGTSIITVNNVSYFANAGDILYLPQGISYNAQYSDTEMLVIHFNTAVSDKVPEVYSNIGFEKIYKAFLSAHVFWQEKKPGYKAYVKSQLYYILGKLSENETTGKMPEIFLNTISYINSNYKDNSLSVEEICKHMGISSTGIRQLFKKYYQTTPTKYITTLRLEYARNLISCGVPIEQAAQRSGFNDPKYFSRVVKKYFLCTPRDLKLYAK